MEKAIIVLSMFIQASFLTAFFFFLFLATYGKTNFLFVIPSMICIGLISGFAWYKGYRSRQIAYFTTTFGIIGIILILLGSMASQLYPSACSVDDMQPNVCSASTNVVSQYQNVTHEEDILVSGNETFTIQDSEFYMIGKITVTDTSILVIRDSKFVTIPTWDGKSIILEDQANLVIINSTVIFKHPSGFECKIIAQDNAQLNITLSTTRKEGDFVAYNNSSIHVRNSTITNGPEPHTEYSGVVTYDVSTAKIENSTIDGVFVWDNSSTSIKNSVVRLVRTGWCEPDKTAVNITSSEVKAIETYGGSPAFHIKGSTITGWLSLNFNASAWVTSCSIAETSASHNANMFLINSSVERIETQGNATVLVGWNLPLFGLVMMHYTLVPILQTFIVIILIAIAVIFLAYLFRKTRIASSVAGKSLISIELLYGGYFGSGRIFLKIATII